MPPPYSDEANAIIAVVKAAGLPHRVTDINTRGIHATSSYHYAQGQGGVGTAVDFAGTTPGTSAAMVTQMSEIWRAFRPHAAQLAELFFQAPGIAMVVKNGAWRPGLQTLGPTVWDAHRNHVHVAVKPGTILRPARLAAVPDQPAVMFPATVHDYEEGATKTTMVHIGKLDANGNGWADWQPGLGRDPIIVGLVQLGPSPADDGYWPNQANVNLSAQPRGGAVRVTVRGGTPGDTVTAFLTVA